MASKKDMSAEITKIAPVSQLPKFMKDETVLGLDTLKQYVVPPRIKVVQKASSAELLKVFSPGDVILAPMNATVVELSRDTKGRPVEGAIAKFLIVPLFFYPEWVTWNPIELKGKEPAIKYRTIDVTDPIVTKSRNANLRTEAILGQEAAGLRIRHVEHLNYVVLLYKHALGTEPAILSFARGEHSAGSKFAGLIKMRKAPIYGCVFEVSSNMRHGTLGDWYGLDTANPETEAPWVNEEDFETFKHLHEEFAKYHKEARLQTQLEPEDAPIDEAATKATDEF